MPAEELVVKLAIEDERLSVASTDIAIPVGEKLLEDSVPTSVVIPVCTAPLPWKTEVFV